MTASLYQEWLLDWDRKLRQEGRKILLLQDNFSGHIIPDTLTNIHVENFEPNLTAHVQPNDQGIIRCFKAHYRARFIQRAVDLYEAKVTASKIYDINQLEAMRLAQDAWNNVDTTTIRNCWKKANILPNTLSSTQTTPAQPTLPISSLIHPTDAVNDSDTGPTVHAETLVERALDDLEATGVLHRSNRMNITELLNPAVETHNLFNATDEDIFDSVMDAKRFREGATNAGGDDIDDVDVSAPAGPTRHELIQAALMLKKHVATLNDPFSRKFEVMLGSFGAQTRVAGMKSAKDTRLTDYFVHN
jgi:DDE superfamily endonuclease